MANKQKSDIVGSIINSIEDSSNFALIKFEKTTHVTLEGLRRELRKTNTKISVIKNTLFEKVVNKLSTTKKPFGEMRKKMFPLREKSALILLKGDWAEGLKAYYEKIKGDEAFSFKFGYIDEQIYDAGDLKKLAKLPGKQELFAKILGGMKNPMVRTTRSLKFNMQKFVYILSQKVQQA